MPGYPWLAKNAGRRRTRSRRKHAHAAHARRAVHRRGDRAGARGAEGQDGAGRADRVPAGHGHRDEEREVAMSASTFLSSVMTVVSFVTFIGIVFWAYSRKRKQRIRRRGERAVRAARRRGRRAIQRAARRARIMSDFTSGFWNIWVIGLTILSIVGCAWLLVVHRPHQGRVEAGARRRRQDRGRRHRPRLGRRPAGVQQPAAEVVVQPVLDHDRVRRRVPDPLSGARHVPRRAQVVVQRRVQRRDRRVGRAPQAAVREVREDGHRADRRRSAGPGHGGAHLPHQLRAMPRVRRARHRQGFPTWPTATGCTAATPRRSSRPSPTAGWASCPRSGRCSARTA